MATIDGILPDILRPMWVRVSAAVLVAGPCYDAWCNQIGLPPIKTIWGMSGALLPWWGWLMIGHALFTAALFDYVRRHTSRATTEPYDDARLRAELARIDEAKAAKTEVRSVADEALEAHPAIIEFKALLLGKVQERVTEQIERLRQLPLPSKTGDRTTDSNINHGLGNKVSTCWIQIDTTLEGLGFNVDQEMEQARAKIEKATAWVLPPIPEEQSKWPTLDAKRNGLIQEAHISTARRLLSEANPANLTTPELLTLLDYQYPIAKSHKHWWGIR